jgi:hypothetical protein
MPELKNGRGGPPGRRRGAVRVAAGSMALLLFGGLFVSTNLLALGAVAATAPCKPPPGGDDDNNGISGGAAAAIGVGAAVAIAAAAGAFGGAAVGAVVPGAGVATGTVGAFPIGGEVDCKEPAPDLPAGQTKISDIRVVPDQSELVAGYQRCYSLVVKSNGKWYSVTNKPETRFSIVDGSATAQSAIVQMDTSGMKTSGGGPMGKGNVFGLPAGSPQSLNGQSVTLQGEWMGHTAEGRITLLVPGI